MGAAHVINERTIVAGGSHSLLCDEPQAAASSDIVEVCATRGSERSMASKDGSTAGTEDVTSLDD